MIIPESLYGLPLLKDIRTQQIELVHRSAQADNIPGADLFMPLYQVPADRLAIVFSWYVDVEPGAPASLLAGKLIAQMNGIPFVLNACESLRSSLGPNPSFQTSGNSGQFWAAPSSFLGVSFLMQTGNVAHVYHSTLSAITIPRGNVALA